jgi:hypothetical protein
VQIPGKPKGNPNEKTYPEEINDIDDDSPGSHGLSGAELRSDAD